MVTQSEGDQRANSEKNEIRKVGKRVHLVWMASITFGFEINRVRLGQRRCDKMHLIFLFPVATTLTKRP